MLCPSCFNPPSGTPQTEGSTSAAEGTSGSSESSADQGTDPDETGTSPGCGNGALDEGEECDEGDANADDATCKSDCTLQVCGDGFVHAGVEDCDDGNDDDSDDCLST